MPYLAMPYLAPLADVAALACGAALFLAAAAYVLACEAL
jgi:hypothetical protein